MAFKSGIAAMRQAIERSNAPSGGAFGGANLSYISWKGGEKKIIRFLTDDFMAAQMYDFILDNTGKTKNFLVDDDDPGRLRRYMSPTPGVGWKKSFKTGGLEEPKPSEKGIIVAVLREEVCDANGRSVVRDVITDREVDGVTLKSRTFGVIIQSLSNFWTTLASSCYDRFGTLTDRDYEIARDGEGLKTVYPVIPLPPVPELDSPEKVRAEYGYGAPWGKDDPERFLKCPMTVEEWASYYSGEDRHRYWLGSREDATPAAPQQSYGDPWASTTHDEPQSTTTGTAFSSLSQTLLSRHQNR